MRTSHGHYAGDLIDRFVASLGPFFQKYIERGLARIDGELRTLQVGNRTKPAAASPIAEYKTKLAHLRTQMFGDAASGLASAATRSPLVVADTAGSPSASPVRTRLDSPAAKFARLAASGPASPASRTQSGVDLSEMGDATITNLRERLARLKNENRQQPTV